MSDENLNSHSFRSDYLDGDLYLVGPGSLEEANTWRVSEVNPDSIERFVEPDDQTYFYAPDGDAVKRVAWCIEHGGHFVIEAPGYPRTVVHGGVADPCPVCGGPGRRGAWQCE